MAIIMTINPIATLATAITTIALLKVFALFPDSLKKIKNGVFIFRAKIRKKSNAHIFKNDKKESVEWAVSFCSEYRESGEQDS
jgi:hypothetical protein